VKKGRRKLAFRRNWPPTTEDPGMVPLRTRGSGAGAGDEVYCSPTTGNPGDFVDWHGCHVGVL